MLKYRRIFSLMSRLIFSNVNTGCVDKEGNTNYYIFTE